MSSKRSGFDGAGGEPIPALAHLGPRKTEDLRGDGEFERAKPVVDERHDQRPGGRPFWRDLVHGCQYRQLSRALQGSKMASLQPGEKSMPTAVTATAPATSPAAVAHFEAEFMFETDCRDVHGSLENGADFVLLDVRSPALFARGALHLARLGRPVKIMVGGITGWLDEGFTLDGTDAQQGQTRS
jgi:hypothetical protein